MTNEKKIQVEELIKADNGALAKELEGVASREDFIKIMAANGVELTAEEADEMLQDIMPQEGELSDDDLEGVAGGMSLLKALKLGWGIGSRAGMLARMLYDKYKYNDAYKNYNWKNVISGKVGINIGGLSL